MALQTVINRRKGSNNNDESGPQQHEFDEEIGETEDDLIENYRFLTQHCGVLRQTPTTGILNTFQQKQQNPQPTYLRQYASISETPNNNRHDDNERSSNSTKPRCFTFNDLNNNNNNNNNVVIVDRSTTSSRVPPTIYYDDTEDNGFSHHRSFSLVKLFARMKTRLKHDRRYHPKSSHEILCEADPQEWYELTKNVRTILTNVLLPDGGYDAMINRSKSHHHQRHNSSKKSREYDPVLPKNVDDADEEKITLDMDETINTENDQDLDQIIWKKFLTCSRGTNYRRSAICKAVDRQQYQGQLVYFYGVANNILIDENLKASGLG